MIVHKRIFEYRYYGVQTVNALGAQNDEEAVDEPKSVRRQLSILGHVR